MTRNRIGLSARLSVGILALFLPIATARAACKEPGKARWTLKSSVPPGSDLSSSTQVALADLLTLGEPVPAVTKNDSRYSKKLIPAFDNPHHLKEGDIVSTEGWIYLIATEGNDCEYHIQMADDPHNGSPCMVVEVPKPDAKSVKSKTLRAKIKSVRNIIRTNIFNGSEPPSSGKVLAQPVYVRITGQLFYDDFHIGTPPRGKKGMKAANLWEIHPVTAIEFVSPPS
jgi:hypothetical protein